MPIKVLYAGLQKDNYNSSRGFSFEYNNFYLTLAHMAGVEVIEHPFDRILEVGKKRFSEELLGLIRREKPNVLFAFMYTDELGPAVLDKIKRAMDTVTVAWFADDYWRFWNYSKHWPAHFHFVVTTYGKAVEWYRAAGFTNVIRSQWACNTAVYKPLNLPKNIDVSFVGQYKPQRARTIAALEKAGIHVEVFGFGWPARYRYAQALAGGPKGKVSREQMLEIVSRSKINLNLSERPGLLDMKVLARLFLKKSANRLVPDFHLIDNFRAYLHFPTPHTHARPFEFAGCRAFVLSGRSEDIGACYTEGKEMAFYDSEKDLIQKINYYLVHNDGREQIAAAAYERTLKEHTYEKRFRDVFEALAPK